MTTTKKTESKAVPVMNYESEVASMRTKLFFLAQLQEEINGLKERFRGLAAQAAAELPGTSSLHFVDGKGGHIQVVIPDETKAANRTLLTAPKIKIAAEAGIDISAENMTEVTRSFKLTGEWVSWLDGVRKQWAADGIKEPAGIAETIETRLTTAALQMLREAQTDIATKLLGLCVKSGAVSAK
jgi:hypothetical protein